MVRPSSKSNESSKAISLCLMGLFLTTLYFNTSLLDPFNTPKFVILLVTSSWMFGFLVNSFRKDKLILLSLETMIILNTFLLILVLLVSLLFSDNFIVSLIGDTQRRNGFLSYMSLTIMFLFLIRCLRLTEVQKIFKTFIVLSFLLTTYGIFQINGSDFVSWNNPYNSMIATLGNPNFASSFLAMSVLISLFSLYIKDLPKIYKYCSILIIPFALYAIVKSQSRQGILVVGIGLMFYITSWAFALKKNYRFYVLLVSIAIFGYSVLGMLQKGPLTSILYKDSVSVRGFYWRAGLEMVKEFPLTGVGIDRYGTFFKQYRESDYPLRYGFEITSSNAHNTFIQHFATSGVFAGILYLTLVVSILILGIILVRKSTHDENRINLALLSTWIGFQAQSLISIENLGISVWGWLFGGAILGLFFSKLKSTRDSTNDNQLTKKSSKVEINLFQPVISMFLTVPIIVISFHLIRMESESYQIRVIVDSGLVDQNKQVLESKIENVLNNPLADPFYQFQAATTLVNTGELERAFEEVSKLSYRDQNNLIYLDWLSRYYNETKNHEKEIKLRLKIADLDPWNAKNYLQLGSIYKILGDQKSTSVMLNKILSFAAGSDIAKQAISDLG